MKTRLLEHQRFFVFNHLAKSASTSVVVPQAKKRHDLHFKSVSVLVIRPYYVHRHIRVSMKVIKNELISTMTLITLWDESDGLSPTKINTYLYYSQLCTIRPMILREMQVSQNNLMYTYSLVVA